MSYLNNPGKLRQHHGYWCPGSFCHKVKVISDPDIDYVFYNVHPDPLVLTHWSYIFLALNHRYDFPTMNITRCWDTLTTKTGTSLFHTINTMAADELEMQGKEDNLSPFDSKIASLCQGSKINNNKCVYLQSQTRKLIGSEVKWAECSLIIGTGYWVQVFAWSSIAESVCVWPFSLLVIWCLRLPRFESCIQQRKTTCLLSIRKSLRCQSIKINNNRPYKGSSICKHNSARTCLVIVLYGTTGIRSAIPICVRKCPSIFTCNNMVSGMMYTSFYFTCISLFLNQI